MVKTILAVLIAAVPAGAGEFTLDRQRAGTLPAVAVPAAPQPAVTATDEAKGGAPLPASFTDWRGKEMTCVSAYDPEGSVTLAFDKQWGVLHRISLEGRPMWQYDGGVTDHRSIHLDGKDLIARTGFLQDLLKKAGLTAAYDSANLTLSAKSFYPTPEATLAKIGDDGSGIVYVDLLKGGRQVGTALFAGWGGIFKDCRPAARTNHGGGALAGERTGRSGFRSSGFYQDRQQAGLAMMAAIKTLKQAGADVVSAEVGAYWAGLYYFELAFISEHALSSHTSAAYFSDEKEARESLRQMAALLADGDRAIIAAELTRDDRGFSYTITALEGAAPAPDYED